MANSMCKLIDEIGRSEAGLEALERDLRPREIRQHERRAAEPHIDRDDETVARADIQHGWLSPAGRIHRCALVHRALSDQLANEGGDHAAADLHPARELSPRDGLVLAHEVECDAPVDIARRGARGATEAEGVDLPHEPKYLGRAILFAM